MCFKVHNNGMLSARLNLKISVRLFFSFDKNAECSILNLVSVRVCLAIRNKTLLVLSTFGCDCLFLYNEGMTL